VTITSRQNPLVVRFRDAARGDGGPILLDGAHLVADAVGARLTIRLAVVTPASREKDDVSELLAALSRMQVEVATVSAPVMDAMSPVRSSSSIVALADRPAIGDGQLYTGEAPLVVVAIDVQDPGNVGAIVRVAEAAGATGVIAAAASANPWGWKALRGSMGSALRLPTMHGVGADRGRPHRRRGPGALALSRRRRRRLRDDPHAATGRLAQRGGHRGDHPLRNTAAAISLVLD